MPTYDYRCEKCRHTFEQFQSITAAPLKKCPACGKTGLVRLIGTGGGLIFKGSGFYITDYRSESYKKAAEAEKGGRAKPDGGAKTGEGGGKADAGSATKPPEKPVKAEAAKSGASRRKADRSAATAG